MTNNTLQKGINEVRRFNRFYTRIIGVLREGLLHSPYSLTEARILFEIANKDGLTASDLCIILGLDPGYLSRTLTKLEQQGLIRKIKSNKDGRQRLLNLTVEGKESFEILNSRSSEEIGEMLDDLSETDQIRLLQAMHSIESILDKGLKFSEPFFIRSHEAGDMGWVTHRHGLLYFQEYGWDQNFEALVSQIVADFIKNFNPDRERCWIAEMNGEKVGSVFVVQHTDNVAKLRLLLVEPNARGLGLGSRLVEECIRFARRFRYKKLILWTNSVLLEARHIYKKKGFSLVKQEEHHSYGHNLIGENWELIL
ncbi:MAG: bifunctional helix-turn-helix transcriptional regulator/GNAT family N-acetyltransferase [Candidatus Hodarchaeales archaeon]|jgi:DNA-binding MarR family transcriptional regulator/N-acetylglutamate synthase-like GNAT family acetyltransferase